MPQVPWPHYVHSLYIEHDALTGFFRVSVNSQGKLGENAIYNILVSEPIEMHERTGTWGIRGDLQVGRRPSTTRATLPPYDTYVLLPVDRINAHKTVEYRDVFRGEFRPLYSM